MRSARVSCSATASCGEATHVFGADGLNDIVWWRTEELSDDGELVDVWRRRITMSA